MNFDTIILFVLDAKCMREEFELILGSEIRFLTIKLREKMNLTQSQMAGYLELSERAYSDIETGVTCCPSALTLVLLLKLTDNPLDFLDQVYLKLENLPLLL